MVLRIMALRCVLCPFAINFFFGGLRSPAELKYVGTFMRF